MTDQQKTQDIADKARIHRHVGRLVADLRAEKMLRELDTMELAEHVGYRRAYQMQQGEPEQI